MWRLKQTFAVLWSVTFWGMTVAAVMVWRRRNGGHPAALLAAMFAILAAVSTLYGILPERSADPVVLWVRKLEAALVVVFPYLLYRFAASFGPRHPRVHLLAGGVTALLCAWALLLSDLPASGDPSTWPFRAYTAAVLVQWLGLATAVAVSLWRAGRRQTTVVRRRMRTLGLGALSLAAALATGGATYASGETVAVQVVVGMLVLASAPLFLVGFAPPSVVRTLWRRSEDASLRLAVARAVGTSTPAALAHVLLPAAAAMVGGTSAVMRGPDRRVVGAYRNEAAPDRGGTTVVDVPLTAGSLEVRTPVYAPFFGREEVDRLRGLGVVIDLALERMRADEQIRVLNDELARRVIELERANKELEAFSYSVSHDLRAPLRAIDGFTSFLIEERAAAMPPDARSDLDTIRQSAQQMGRLIDDLLTLSRTGRHALDKRRVEPAVIARAALAELEIERHGRRIDVTIGELAPCDADPSLLKHVYLNLIANAMKFTRGRDPGVVEIGCTLDDGSSGPVYFVRDNGVGFDMRYVGKLFGVFQRLHREEDFEGTGVGLAIVQRIVRRHGGDIWAQGEVGAGARFEFVLQ